MSHARAGGAPADRSVVRGRQAACLRTGTLLRARRLPKRLPVRSKLATFPVKVEGGTVFVHVGGGKHIQVSYDDDETEE